MHHEFYHLAKNLVSQKDHSQYALATVFHVRGSAYRREGTRMLISENGTWFGNISGGCLEGDILQKAKQVIRSKESILLTYDTRESSNKEIRIALGCNGIIDIVIEAVDSKLLEFCKSVVNLFDQQKTAYASTSLELFSNKIEIQRQLSPEVPKKLQESLFQNEIFCHVEKSEHQIVLNEFIGLQRKLVIWGAGPDVYPLVHFSKQLGWKTLVASDCNIEYLKERLPDTPIFHCNFDDFLAKTSPHENTAVVLVSHDFYKDYFILEKIVEQPLKYIGIMGPKRRGARMLEELVKRNPELDFKQELLHYPVGLDIGSDNPTEIALSIIAEIQAHFSGKNASPLSNKKTRIHESAEESPEEYNPSESTCSINSFV